MYETINDFCFNEDVDGTDHWGFVLSVHCELVALGLAALDPEDGNEIVVTEKGKAFVSPGRGDGFWNIELLSAVVNSVMLQARIRTLLARGEHKCL